MQRRILWLILHKTAAEVCFCIRGRCPCLWKWGWDEMSFKVPPKPFQDYTEGHSFKRERWGQCITQHVWGTEWC